MRNTAPTNQAATLAAATAENTMAHCVAIAANSEPANASEAGWLNTNIKTYPTAMDSKMGVISAGMEFNCVGSRDYFSPRDDPDASCVYWHPEGDDILVYADYHQKLDSTLVKLPPEFTGRKIAIVEQTPSINLQTKDIVPSAGIALSVAENYGYIVLKLSSP